MIFQAHAAKPCAVCFVLAQIVSISISMAGKYQYILIIKRCLLFPTSQMGKLVTVAIVLTLVTCLWVVTRSRNPYQNDGVFNCTRECARGEADCLLHRNCSQLCTCDYKLCADCQKCKDHSYRCFDECGSLSSR